LGRLASRLNPPARAAGEELDSHSHPGGDSHLTGVLEDVEDLLEEVHHNHNIVYIMDAQGQAQIVLILVAVADEQRLSWQAQGEGGEKLRLCSHLQAYAVFGPIFYDIFDDLFSLIDLHGKDGLVGALVGELFNGCQK